VLSSSLHLQNFIKLDSAKISTPENNVKAGYSDPFYSVLLKYQINMMRAWVPSENNSESDMDPFALSKALLKLKDFNYNNALGPSINSKRVMQSYETVKILEDDKSGPDKSLKSLTGDIAVKYDIPETLFKKLIHTESAYDPKALSPRGAMGLGQIMPATAEELGLVVGDAKTPGSVWHPESNLDASARYLKNLFDKYRKEGIDEKEAWSFAAGAYNAGMGNIAKAISKISHEPVKTWDQVAQVLPQVTGKHSQETIRYVNRLRA
jgi:soluble lytic murein transglycosylase-like protein